MEKDGVVCQGNQHQLDLKMLKLSIPSILRFPGGVLEKGWSLNQSPVVNDLTNYAYCNKATIKTQKERVREPPDW